MKKSGNTIIITGGSSGIGLELTKRLYQENTVIICGRSQSKLEQAKELCPDIHTYQCDLSNQQEVGQFCQWIIKHFPQVNVLINNAALVHATNFELDDQMIQKAALEINTNFLAPVILTKSLLNTLQQNQNPTVVNVTTGLVFVPRVDYPIYCATKSALHAFTEVLRSQVKHINVIEVFMTVVDTPWHNGHPPKIAISTNEAVDLLLAGLYAGKQKILIGKVRLLYFLSRFFPGLAFRKLNSL